MTSQAVIRSFYAISGVYTLSASLIWGVSTLYLLHAGLNIFGAFLSGAAFTAGNVLFDIPTGVVADTAGRRAAFLLSAPILCVGTLAYVAIPHLGWHPLLLFIVASVVIGLGFSFYTGALEAWLVDALTATGFQGSLDTVFTRGAMVTGAAMLVGTLAGGLLGQIDLAAPFLARSALLAVAFALALFRMHDLGFEPRPLRLTTLRAELVAVAKSGLRHGWGQRSLRLLMLSSAVQTGFILWGFYAWQPYFQQLLRTDAIWFTGLIAAGIAASTMLGNAVVDHFARLCGNRTTLLLWAASIQTLAAIAIGLAPDFPIALTALLIATATLGVVEPVRQAYLHRMVASDRRATVVSFDSMVGNLGGVGGQAGLGYLAKISGFATGYVAGGAATALVIPLYLAIRRLAEDADRIVGKAGKDSPCAARGLAGLGAVDDKARATASASA